MFIKRTRGFLYLAGVLCIISYAGKGGAGMVIPQEENPDACLGGIHSGGFHSAPCGRWYTLTELQNPDACLGGTHSGGFHSAPCGRWYGVSAPVAVKEKVIVYSGLKGIHFDFDKSNIREESLPILQKDVASLKSRGNESIKVIGYTDSIGSDAYNQKLSERRAEAVRQYFISQGVDASLISAEGRGEANPVAPNVDADGKDNPDGRGQNRRIEVHMLGR